MTLPVCTGHLLPGTTTSFLYHKVKINREVFLIALAHIFQRWGGAVGLFLLCVIQTQQQFCDHRKGVFWYLPSFRKNGSCICRCFKHLSSRRNCSRESVLYENSGNAPLSSAKVLVPILKILKWINGNPQYEGKYLHEYLKLWWCASWKKRNFNHCMLTWKNSHHGYHVVLQYGGLFSSLSVLWREVGDKEANIWQAAYANCKVEVVNE